MATSNEKKSSVEQLVRLQCLNRRKVYDYYRAQTAAGPTRGENIVMERVFGALVAADEMAQQGKEWNPL